VPSDLPAGQAQSFSLDTSKMNEALITRAAGAGSLTDRADGAAIVGGGVDPLLFGGESAELLDP
jgi:hypothetical protein